MVEIKQNRTVFKQALSIILIFVLIFLMLACAEENAIRIDLSKQWKFSADTEKIGDSLEWYSEDFDDSKWEIIDAGIRWEEQGYKELDEIGWYRKRVNIPESMNGKNIWIKFGGVNDEYELFINGKSVSHFGEAGISVASRPTFTKLNEVIKYGATNTICLKVNDWGNSGGVWRLPAVITTDEGEVSNIFKPIDSTIYTAEKLGYKLFWEDQFQGRNLDSDKWSVRGIGPRAAGYVSPDAVVIKDGY